MSENIIDESIRKKNILDCKAHIPHIIKYMGSKRELIKHLINAINEIYEGESICDLFSGTCVLSGAIGHRVRMHSNDIQEYSGVLANTYLNDCDWSKHQDLLEKIIGKAQAHVTYVSKLYPELNFSYNSDLTLNEFNAIEQQQQELIYLDFEDVSHHLFIKNYSGTYWSFEQCLWIDAIRIAAEEYYGTPVFPPLLASLMFAMAYNAQSTGHYAQYRDAHNIASMNDIVSYRTKQILPYFKSKLTELIEYTGYNHLKHAVTSLDYRDCLNIIQPKTLVYADPPYAFVHYSRFYHALETLVKYDYPEVTHKGRYRNDRHQSPFCKRTTVSEAFHSLFKKIAEKSCKLVLSYSNAGMISLEEILKIASLVLGDNYLITTRAIDYTHSTMGRLDDKSREVQELLIIAQPK